MNKKILALSVLFGLPALACAGNNTGDYTYELPDLAGIDSAVSGLQPVPPFVGQQIDRMGRPGVSYLMIGAFDLVTGKTPAQVKDAYNAATSQTDAQAGWPSFGPRPYIAEALAVWDGIDGTCGNQIMAAAAPVQPSRYLTLGTLLANDYLLIDTTKTVCNAYLAVERNDASNCGGREPNLPNNLDVVNLSLNILAGTQAAMTFTNGVTADGDGPPSNSQFPFLLPPN